MRTFVYNLTKYLYDPENNYVISVEGGTPKMKEFENSINEDSLSQVEKDFLDDTSWTYLKNPDKYLESINDTYGTNFELWDLYSPNKKRTLINNIFNEFYDKLKSYRLSNYKIESNNYSTDGYIANVLIKTDVNESHKKLNHLLSIIKERPSSDYFEKRYENLSRHHLKFYEEVEKLIETTLDTLSRYEENPIESIKSKLSFSKDYFDANNFYYRTIHIDSKDTLSEILLEHLKYQKAQSLVYFLKSDPISSLDDLKKRNILNLNIHQKNEEQLEVVGESYSVKTIKQGRKDTLKTELSDVKIKNTKTKRSTLDMKEDIKKMFKDLKLIIVTLRKKKINKEEREIIDNLFPQIFFLEESFDLDSLNRKELHDLRHKISSTFDDVFKLRRKYR